MNRNEFEAAAKGQNAAAAQARSAARANGAPCSITPMLAFGGIDYCTAHGVMGPCPYTTSPAPFVGTAFNRDGRQVTVVVPVDERGGK